MSKKWDGKTKGSPWGYRFFISCIQTLGVRFSYFFCIWVSAYYLLFSSKNRNAIIHFYQTGLGFSKVKAFFYSFANFYQFGKIIIDRFALRTRRKSFYTHSFKNEEAIRSITTQNMGGFLVSGHIGNWENAGSLIGERITAKINILMLDEEVEKIKQLIDQKIEKPKYNLIPLKNDMSHLILIHQALKRNELIALHADRIQDEHQKYFTFNFLNGKAKFPAGPFIMAHKFKVPIVFVYAVKTSTKHFALSSSDVKIGGKDFHNAEELAQQYVHSLEQLVKEYPTQWFNFYEYFD